MLFISGAKYKSDGKKYVECVMIKHQIYIPKHISLHLNGRVVMSL